MVFGEGKEKRKFDVPSSFYMPDTAVNVLHELPI